MRFIARSAVVLAVAGSALSLGSTAPAQAYEESGSVPVASGCRADYRVVADVDTYGKPPVNVSGTDVGVECP